MERLEQFIWISIFIFQLFTGPAISRAPHNNKGQIICNLFLLVEAYTFTNYEAIIFLNVCLSQVILTFFKSKSLSSFIVPIRALRATLMQFMFYAVNKLYRFETDASTSYQITGVIITNK